MPRHYCDGASPLAKSDVLAILWGVGIRPAEYWVIMGAALVLHGVRTATSDIDLAVSDTAFAELVASGRPPLTSRSGRAKMVLDDRVVVYRDWIPASWSLYSGIQVADLTSIMAEKWKLSRDKDLADIDEIKRHLAREGASRRHGRD